MDHFSTFVRVITKILPGLWISLVGWRLLVDDRIAQLGVIAQVDCPSLVLYWRPYTQKKLFWETVPFSQSGLSIMVWENTALLENGAKTVPKGVLFYG